MCNCGSKGKIPVVPGCPGLNKSLAEWQSYLAKYQCVVSGNKYIAVGLTQPYVLSQISIIQASITNKQQDSNSCQYSQYVTGILSDITVINSNGC